MFSSVPFNVFISFFTVSALVTFSTICHSIHATLVYIVSGVLISDVCHSEIILLIN